MRLGHRIALTFLIVVVILFALALFGCWTGRWDEDAYVQPFSLASAQTQPELCMDDATKDGIRSVMLESLDHALQLHIENAFAVWMKDPTGQPARAKVGVERGVRAYINARKGVMEWNPPPCAG